MVKAFGVSYAVSPAPDADYVRAKPSSQPLAEMPNFPADANQAPFSMGKGTRTPAGKNFGKVNEWTND